MSRFSAFFSTFCLILTTSIASGLDRDGDGLDDVWQWYFQAESLEPSADTDGDGVNNLQESLAATNPFDPNQRLRPGFRGSAAEVSLHWQTQLGVSYQISTGTDVSAVTDFDALGVAVTGNGEVFTLVLNADGTGSIISARGDEEELTIASDIDLGEALAEQAKRYFHVQPIYLDSDSDDLSDWAELTLGENIGLDPNEAETQPGTADADALIAWYESREVPEITVVSTDRCAFENNAPLEGEDNGEITITRTGVLPVTIELVDMGIEYTGNTSVVCNGQCCIVVGVAGDEPAEPADYQLYDEQNQPITGSIHFATGETTKVITVKANDDGIYEYPETLNLAAAPSTDGTYTLGSTNGASIQFLDSPDEPENEVILIGSFSQDGRAVTATNGNGYISAKINGSRRAMTITSEFSNLTSPQQDCHVHKANPGPTAGSIIYAITETPYDETSDPLNGPLSDYPWDITESGGATPTAGGAASRQVIIDSLFGQNGETPLYLNIHTIDNPAGEIWSFFAQADGSSSDPGAPVPADAPGSDEFPILTGMELEREVRRFLDQATFGGTEDQVAVLLNEINTRRITNPTYHRVTAFETWIDDQVNLDQTYMLDYLVADYWQLFTNAGHFDPARNPGREEDGMYIDTPVAPSVWPAVDRSNPDSEKWVMNQRFPLEGYELAIGSRNQLDLPGSSERRNASWMLMLNAHDQLRQKLGYSLQQIILVSAAGGEIERQRLAYANYIDQLNNKAFSHYRDLLGFANNSPIMGNWLSSLMNQREADLDGDGEPDVFADENLARENMQLFSIGLFETWADGSLRLDSDGSPIPTYNNDDIRELSKILTGQSFSKNIDYFNSQDDWGGPDHTFDTLPDNTEFDSNLNQSNYNDIAYHYPMTMFHEYHDTSAVKTIAGGKQINNFEGVDIANTSDETLKQLAQKDIEDAIDWIAGKPSDGQPDFDGVSSHGSTPAFICRRLIQRFTTSNPSSEYLHRVSHAFAVGEGDMLATIKAILLDPEARDFDINNTTFGLKKNPLEAYIQLHRNMQAITRIPLTEPASDDYAYEHALGDYSASSNPNLYLQTFNYPASQIDNHSRNFRFNQAAPISSSTGLQIDMHEQATVFNWYLPDFSPGGTITAAGLVSPEMQLINDTDVIRNINYFENLCRDSALSTSTRLGGRSGNSLSGRIENQKVAFKEFDNVDVDRNDNIQLPIDQLAEELYPATPPPATDTRTSESLADEALVDIIDRRLTWGLLKEKYPYDPSDDDDPSTPEIDDRLKNPREAIIDALTFHSDPWGSSGESNRLNKTEDALWMITFTPEFNIRK